MGQTGLGMRGAHTVLYKEKAPVQNLDRAGTSLSRYWAVPFWDREGTLLSRFGTSGPGRTLGAELGIRSADAGIAL